MESFEQFVAEIRACRLCAEHLPMGARPVFQITSGARMLLAGQAPGRKVHETGITFNDPSGDRLRDWLGVTREQFYDPSLFAILPMGFCFPGTGSGGDLPPRPECAATWRARLLEHLPDLELTVVMGRYALDYHFDQPGASVTDLVRAWRESWPIRVPLPHPSPRNNRWLRLNPWFEAELIPELRDRVRSLLQDA